MTNKIYTPPGLIPSDISDGIFLAGSIEQDTAEDWQSVIAKELIHIHNVFNPRRNDWDSSWVEDITNEQFAGQVLWELNALKQAKNILMYFSPGTKSPISLLELGLFAASGKITVFCPDGFWKRGNVEIVCQQFDIPFKPVSILDYFI